MYLWAILLTGILSDASAHAQMPGLPAAAVTASATPSPKPSPSATPYVAPTPVPLSEVVMQAEAASVSLREIEAALAADTVNDTVGAQLPTFSREIEARIVEDRKIIAARPSLETLRNLAMDWRQQSETLSAWERDLTDRAGGLDNQITQLANFDVTWGQTQQATKKTDTPPDVLSRIKTIVDTTDDLGEKVAKRRAQIIDLQDRVALLQGRVADALSAAHAAQDAAIRQLFVQDSPTIWNAVFSKSASANLAQDSTDSFVSQRTALIAYASLHETRILLHLLLVLLFSSAMAYLRARVRPLLDQDATLRTTGRVFGAPLATGFTLSLLFHNTLYPQPPRLLLAILGAVALLPTILLLRRLIDRSLYPILNALILFYFADQIRSLTASLPILSRVLFIVEMIGGIVFCIGHMRAKRLSAAPEVTRDHVWMMMRTGLRAALGVFVFALAANVFGFVSLANLVGDAVLRSAYLALFLYALLQIANGLIEIALRVRPLRFLGMVQRHRDLLARRVYHALIWIAGLYWFLQALILLSLIRIVFEKGRVILDASLSVGSVRLSLGHVLAFAVTLCSAIMLSRFLRFLLEEDVYPRFDLPRGMPYAITTMLHYVVLLAGFFIAIAAMGFDMTKFTILAGAFGVGLGFGMQNIVNNFVSGLILLFERPVNVGDLIQMDDASGIVQSIGIRASIIRTASGSEIIVPNGKLISDRVTNWTLSNNLRSVVIPVTVTAAGANPAHVIDVLTSVAAAHPLVSKNPPPEALFVKFGPATLDFELHAWTEEFTEWERIRSELAVALNTAFVKEGITTP